MTYEKTLYGKKYTNCRYIFNSMLVKMQRIKIICIIYIGWNKNWNRRLLVGNMICWMHKSWTIDESWRNMKLKRWQTKLSSSKSNKNVQSCSVTHDGVCFINSCVIIFGMALAFFKLCFNAYIGYTRSISIRWIGHNQIQLLRKRWGNKKAP